MGSMEVFQWEDDGIDGKSMEVPERLWCWHQLLWRSMNVLLVRVGHDGKNSKTPFTCKDPSTFFDLG